jgi:hypothetical protein
LGMTGKMPVATKSFSFSVITFENRYTNFERSLFAIRHYF